MSIRNLMIVILVLAMPGIALPAAEPAKTEVKIAPPLAGLPSKPGPHIEQIKALGDNAWLKLPETAADPNCPSWGGKSYGRSWTPKAAYVSELGGAFITGEGAHCGTDNKTGYYGDDVWFYDLYANRWIALYPGTHIPSFDGKLKSGELTIDDAGIIHEKTGMPVPAGTMSGHAGFLLDYDKAQRKFFWPGSTCGWLTGGLKAPYEAAVAAQGKKKAATGIWLYDVATGKFEYQAYAGLPYKGTCFNFLQYVPSTGAVLDCDLKGQDWWLDLKAGTVKKVKAGGDRPAAGSAYGSCYDSKRDRVYVWGAADYGIAKDKWVPEDHFFYYDVKAGNWVKPKAKNSPALGNFGWGRWMMEYDSVNDRVMVMYIIHGLAKEDRKIHVYNADANEFEPPIPVTDEQLPTGFGHSFFCPELNAYFIHRAGGDNQTGNTWVWRYKRAPEARK
ncbi:MAG TPA: hypothetical protein PK280_04365 [Planctomycetota bacterium]|nr:hypothetical protein [Planctomycetota bacterium]